MSQNHVRLIQTALESFGFSPGKIDGLWGPKTQKAFDAYVGSLSKPTQGEFDERTEKNIATLLPQAQEKAREFMRLVRAKGINAKIIDGSRTHEQQQKLYNQGRTTPGDIVTNALPGRSWHNYAVAFDVGLFGDNGEYIEESPLYKMMGKIGESIGLEWGGSWGGDLVDEPHYQLNPKKISLNLAMRLKAKGLTVFDA